MLPLKDSEDEDGGLSPKLVGVRETGATGAKFERGADRRMLLPANVGPMANGPLAVISTTGGAPLPRPLDSPRPLPIL